MPQQYDNTNSGAIFKNKYKETEKHPCFTGPLDVDGVEYSIAAWSKVSDKHGKYLSIKISKKEDKAVAQSSSADSTDAPF